MTWRAVEQIFQQSLISAFSKKKFLFTFPILVVCGLMIVFCRALAVGAGNWILLSLTFLPIFLSFGLLLALGVLLIRVYSLEISGKKASFGEVLSDSWQLLLGASYLSLPLVLGYLLLWTILGVFYLLKEIPSIGETLGVLLSFGPFLLVLGTLVLAFFNFFFLFFASPYIAAKNQVKLELAENAFRIMLKNIFSYLFLFFLALVPLCVMVGVLSLAAYVTGMNFLQTGQSLTIALQWFFIMLPFCGICTPAVIFFFHFSAESYQFIESKQAA